MPFAAARAPKASVCCVLLRRHRLKHFHATYSRTYLFDLACPGRLDANLSSGSDRKAVRPGHAQDTDIFVPPR